MIPKNNNNNQGVFLELLVAAKKCDPLIAPSFLISRNSKSAVFHEKHFKVILFQ